MTFVDVVFPAFLFIVGMSLPLACRARLMRGDTPWQVHKHATVRALGLLVMGYFLVNRWHFNAEVAAVNYFFWTLGAHLCILLVWMKWPKETSDHRTWNRLAKGLGWAGFAALFWAFCSGDWEHHMVRSWWGILGLIGWAYFISYICWQLSGGNATLLFGFILLFVGFRTGEAFESFSLPLGLGFLREFAGISVLASISLVGVLVSERFLGPGESAEGRFRWLAALTTILFLTGAALRAHLGASKIQATPTWGLYSAGFCCLCFGLLYFLLDVKKSRAWARPFLPAGKNPLLLYLMPGIVFCTLGILHIEVLDEYFGSGGLRIFRAAALAGVFLWLTILLTKRGLVIRI